MWGADTSEWVSFPLWDLVPVESTLLVCYLWGYPGVLSGVV